MKHPIVMILAVNGAVFVGLIIVLMAYIFIAKPLSTEQQTIPTTITQPQSDGGAAGSGNPLLTPAQEATLRNLGVDTSALPTTISPEQMQCAVEALGEARVQELIAGAQITLTDMYKAGGCF